MDYERRNSVLRAYIAGRDWDTNAEFQLVRRLVAEGDVRLGSLTLLFDYEWEVSAGHSNHGCGDLVFTDGSGSFAVVEVKFIDDTRSGRTVRGKRRKSRKHVKKQALDYAADLRQTLGADAQVVRAFIYTNQLGLVPADVPGDDEVV